MVLAFAVLLLGCGDSTESGISDETDRRVVKAPVALASVMRQPFLYEAVGTVEARIASTLSSKLMGTVMAVRVREGDEVKEGNLLVEIDARQVSAQLRSAKASLDEAKKAKASAESAIEAAQAGAQLAKSTYDRYQKLMAERSASKQEFDQAEARHRQAKASLAQAEAMVEAADHRVQQAEAAVAAAQISKRDASVLAPYDGKVTAKMIDVGDLAAPGTPFLTLEKEGVYCVALVLPEKHIHAVRLDQEVDVMIPSLREGPLRGFIGRIDPTADQQSRSFRVKVALPEEDRIRSGMFARVAIPVGEAGILTIPQTAVVNQGQLTGVFLLDDQQIARFRLIRIGRTFGDTVEVISGLKDGDRYVVSQTPDLANGVKVEAAS